MTTEASTLPLRRESLLRRLRPSTRARGGEAMGKIAAREPWTADAPLLLFGHEIEVPASRRLRPFDDPIGDLCDGGIESHGAYVVLRAYSCQLIPSRSVSAIAAEGPHVPAG